jgi:hypothetical protein
LLFREPLLRIGLSFGLDWHDEAQATGGSAFSGQLTSHVASCARNVSHFKKLEVAKEFGVPEADWSPYEFDHLTPLNAGTINQEQAVKEIFDWIAQH